MADEQQCAAEFQQQGFEPLDGGDVQVVGGLVQQQQFGFHHQRTRQQHAAAPATREVFVARFTIEGKLRKHGGHAGGDFPVLETRRAGNQARSHDFIDGGMGHR